MKCTASLVSVGPNLLTLTHPYPYLHSCPAVTKRHCARSRHRTAAALDLNLRPLRQQAVFYENNVYENEYGAAAAEAMHFDMTRRTDGRTDGRTNYPC